jgi:uncharacterized membrane protein YfcA
MRNSCGWLAYWYIENFTPYLASLDQYMLAYLQNLLALSATELAITGSVVLLASIVRGFSGFGLSALIMAGLALIITPVMLIPICFLLEGAASLLMLKGVLRQANRQVEWVLAIGSAVGVPIGLWATMSIPAEISQTIALLLILLLAGLQLLKLPLAIFSTQYGLYITGLLAGIATGIAGVGGMVVALFILAQRITAPQMRASLVMFLFLSMFTSSIWLTLTGLLNTLAIFRALALVPLVVIGVCMGAYLFRPSLEHLYKLFCLCLLLALASIGLLRMVLSA